MLAKAPSFSWVRSIGLTRLAGVTILATVGAYVAFAIAVSGVMRTKNPELTLTLWPLEGDALAATADQLFFANPENPAPQVQQLARKSLRQKALNPRALRLLGYYADFRGDPKTANALMQKAVKFSRRELGAQLWLIEASARRNNVAQTLKHYDIALSTKTQAQELLFPRLLEAIDSEEVRLGLKPYMRDRRVWTREFLSYAITKNRNLAQIAELVSEASTISRDDSNIEMRLLSKLLAEGEYSIARRLYLQFPDAKAGLLTAVDFNLQFGPLASNPMAWQLFDDPDVGGNFESTGRGQAPVLSLYANPWTTRLIASKILYLDLGAYKFSSNLSILSQGDGGVLKWQMRCPGLDGNPIWASENKSLQARVTFTVPESCTTQILEIILSGGKGQTGLEATIASVSIAPTN